MRYVLVLFSVVRFALKYGDWIRTNATPIQRPSAVKVHRTPNGSGRIRTCCRNALYTALSLLTPLHRWLSRVIIHAADPKSSLAEGGVPFVWVRQPSGHRLDHLPQLTSRTVDL